MTSLYLVRHGETDWNKSRRIQGHSDIQLNDTGREQASRTAELLASRRWDAVYSSPLSRAWETASIIAGRLGFDGPTALPGVIERNYGQAEGLTYDELAEKFPFGSDVTGRESREHAAARAVPALIEAARRHAEGSVLVVSHGGLIRSVLTHLEPEHGLHHDEPITNGSVHSLRYGEDGLRLIAFNDPLRRQTIGDEASDIELQNALEQREQSPS